MFRPITGTPLHGYASVAPLTGTNNNNNNFFHPLLAPPPSGARAAIAPPPRAPPLEKITDNLTIMLLVIMVLVGL
jgi:hypothetical protein